MMNWFKKLILLILVDLLEKQIITLTVGDETPDITNLAIAAALNTKWDEVKAETPSITGWAAITAATTVEDEIHEISGFVKKTDYYGEIKDIKDKYFITSDYKKLKSNLFNTKIKEKNLLNLILLIL